MERIAEVRKARPPVLEAKRTKLGKVASATVGTPKIKKSRNLLEKSKNIPIERKKCNVFLKIRQKLRC